MPTPKNIQITDVEMGVLQITPLIDGVLTINRTYKLLGNHPALAGFPDQNLSRSLSWADVPQNIKDALVSIDQWTYNEILEQEGME